MGKTITVYLNDKAVSVPAGTALKDVLRSESSLPMPCGGHGKCGKCRVFVAGSVNAPTDEERRLLSEKELASGVRLACRVVLNGEARIRTQEAVSGVRIVSEGVLPAYEPAPFFTQYGAAIDIGTTTLAAALYDPSGALLAKTSRMNPESRWGADVISRMEAARAGKRDEIAAVIRGALSDMLGILALEAGVTASAIDAIVITGNTVMLSFLYNEDTEPLTHAPFIANRLFGETVTAAFLGLTGPLPETKVCLPPCAAGFVGADISCAVLSSGLLSSDETAVLVDIGTNGEMVLSHGGELYACSTAAGPAFEGAGISMGMNGGDGAVDRVWLKEDGALEAHVIGEGEAKGICGSGLVDAVACLLKNETLDETGRLEEDPAVILPPVRLTGKDIRMVQLAKSAIHAGMRTLIGAAGLTPKDVRCLYIAGGFGNYLDIENAAAIGLIPEELKKNVRILGNAALSGASLLLLSKGLQEDVRTLAERIRIVELSANPVFADEYMERMFF